MKIISDYSDKGVEKTMLVREVILKAIAKVYSWVQAAEILGYSPRHMSRIKKRYEEYGFDGLFDRRTKTGPRIIKMEDLEKILTLYRIFCGIVLGYSSYPFEMKNSKKRCQIYLLSYSRLRLTWPGVFVFISFLLNRYDII